MKADNRVVLISKAIKLQCPYVKPVNEDASFGTCYAQYCQMWRERSIRGSRSVDGKTPPPIVAYEGWCGLAGNPADECDFTSEA